MLILHVKRTVYEALVRQGLNTEPLDKAARETGDMLRLLVVDWEEVVFQSETKGLFKINFDFWVMAEIELDGVQDARGDVERKAVLFELPGYKHCLDNRHTERIGVYGRTYVEWRALEQKLPSKLIETHHFPGSETFWAQKFEEQQQAAAQAAAKKPGAHLEYRRNHMVEERLFVVPDDELGGVESMHFSSEEQPEDDDEVVLFDDDLEQEDLPPEALQKFLPLVSGVQHLFVHATTADPRVESRLLVLLQQANVVSSHMLETVLAKVEAMKSAYPEYKRYVFSARVLYDGGQLLNLLRVAKKRFEEEGKEGSRTDFGALYAAVIATCDHCAAELRVSGLPSVRFLLQAEAAAAPSSLARLSVANITTLRDHLNTQLCRQANKDGPAAALSVGVETRGQRDVSAAPSPPHVSFADLCGGVSDYASGCLARNPDQNSLDERQKEYATFLRYSGLLVEVTPLLYGCFRAQTVYSKGAEMTVVFLDSRLIGDTFDLVTELNKLDRAQSTASRVVQRPVTEAQYAANEFPAVLSAVTHDAHTLGTATKRAKVGTLRSGIGAPGQRRHFWKVLSHFLLRGPQLWPGQVVLALSTQQWLDSRIRFSNAEEAKIQAQRLGLRKVEQQSNMKELLLVLYRMKTLEPTTTAWAALLLQYFNDMFQGRQEEEEAGRLEVLNFVAGVFEALPHLEDQLLGAFIVSITQLMGPQRPQVWSDMVLTSHLSHNGILEMCHGSFVSGLRYQHGLFQVQIMEDKVAGAGLLTCPLDTQASLLAHLVVLRSEALQVKFGSSYPTVNMVPTHSKLFDFPLALPRRVEPRRGTTRLVSLSEAQHVHAVYQGHLEAPPVPSSALLQALSVTGVSLGFRWECSRPVQVLSPLQSPPAYKFPVVLLPSQALCRVMLSSALGLLMCDVPQAGEHLAESIRHSVRIHQEVYDLMYRTHEEMERVLGMGEAAWGRTLANFPEIADSMMYVVEMRKLFRLPTLAHCRPWVTVNARHLTDSMHLAGTEHVGESRRLAEIHGDRNVGEVEAQNALTALHAAEDVLKGIANLCVDDLLLQEVVVQQGGGLVALDHQPRAPRMQPAPPQRHGQGTTIATVVALLEQQKTEIWNSVGCSDFCVYHFPLPSKLLGIPMLPSDSLPDLVCDCCTLPLFFQSGVPCNASLGAAGTVEFQSGTAHHWLVCYGPFDKSHPQVRLLPANVEHLLVELPVEISNEDFDAVAKKYSHITYAMCVTTATDSQTQHCERARTGRYECRCRKNFAFATEETLVATTSRNWTKKEIEEALH